MKKPTKLRMIFNLIGGIHNDSDIHFASGFSVSTIRRRPSLIVERGQAMFNRM